MCDAALFSSRVWARLSSLTTGAEHGHCHRWELGSRCEQAYGFLVFRGAITGTSAMTRRGFEATPTTSRTQHHRELVRRTTPPHRAKLGGCYRTSNLARGILIFRCNLRV